MATKKKVEDENKRGSAEPAATAEKKKGESAVAGLDIVVRELTDKVEKAVAEVGGDIPRGFATRAVALMREAQELLYKAEREDR